jgi:hypothetical protein
MKEATKVKKRAKFRVAAEHVTSVESGVYIDFIDLLLKRVCERVEACHCTKAVWNASAA